jgi:hypothetical protein
MRPLQLQKAFGFKRLNCDVRYDALGYSGLDRGRKGFENVPPKVRELISELEREGLSTGEGKKPSELRPSPGGQTGHDIRFPE